MAAPFATPPKERRPRKTGASFPPAFSRASDLRHRSSEHRTADGRTPGTGLSQSGHRRIRATNHFVARARRRRSIVCSATLSLSLFPLAHPLPPSLPHTNQQQPKTGAPTLVPSFPINLPHEREGAPTHPRDQSAVARGVAGREPPFSSRPVSAAAQTKWAGPPPRARTRRPPPLHTGGPPRPLPVPPPAPPPRPPHPPCASLFAEGGLWGRGGARGQPAGGGRR